MVAMGMVEMSVVNVVDVVAMLNRQVTAGWAMHVLVPIVNVRLHALSCDPVTGANGRSGHVWPERNAAAAGAVCLEPVA